MIDAMRRILRGGRGAALVMLVALAAVVARPICDAQAMALAPPAAASAAAHAGDSQGHSHDADPCCDSIESGALVASTKPVPGSTAEGKSVLASPPAIAAAAASSRIACIARPPDSAIRVLSYHARSSRILA